MNTFIEAKEPLIDLKMLLREAGLGYRPLFLLKPLLSKLLAVRELNSIYARVQSELDDCENDPDFFRKTLKVMGVHFEMDAKFI